LQVRDTTLDSITLGWTTPIAQGEDFFYDLRYLEASEMGTATQMTEALWAVADTVSGEPPVSHAGADASYVIGGLISGLEYFAAIRTVSAADSTMSDISNTVSTTVDAYILECSSPGLSIPDNTPAGVSDVIAYPHELEIMGLQVYVNITHTWIGDLIVTLTSPGGTTVRLHNMTGVNADNIVGTYGLDLAVDGPGSLADFIGEPSLGNWTLFVSDNQGADLGTLNEWCVGVWGTTP